MSVNKEENVFAGIELGDCRDDYENFTGFLEKYYDLTKLRFVLIHVSKRPVGDGTFMSWASFFKKHGISFAFLYTQQRGAPDGRKSQLTVETVKGIKEIAGDLYLGDMIGETGGYISWYEGYFNGNESLPYADGSVTVKSAHDDYVKRVSEFVKLDRELGIENVLSVEATTASRFNFEAGVTSLFLELMCGDPEIMLASARGVSKSFLSPYFGCHIAHEWYGGLRNDDPLKYKRLRLAYEYAYMSGARYIYPESGDNDLVSYGYHYDKDHEFCRTYRDEWERFADYVRENGRPAGGPIVKTAFVQGLYDSYNGWGCKTVWDRFGNEKWGYSDAENSWRVLSDIVRRDRWHTVENYGESDMSAMPAYGQYDIICAQADVSVMSLYDTLIFAGSNVMTPELLEKLRAFVKNGGKLFITAAHLSVSDSPEKEYKIIKDGNFGDFFGFVYENSVKNINKGYKFRSDSIIPGVLYPASKDGLGDPVLPGGYVRFADVSLTGGRIAAVAEDSFREMRDDIPVLIENKYGKGYVVTLLSVDYPGKPSVYPLYSRIVRDLVIADKKAAEVRVDAGDDVSYAVYEDGGDLAVFLLNTNYDCKCFARVTCGKHVSEVVLDPMEMKKAVIPSSASFTRTENEN